MDGQVTYLPWEVHLPTQGWSPTNRRMVTLFGPAWPRLTSFIWPGLPMFGPIWQCLVLCCPVWPNLAPFKPGLARIGPVWPGLARLARFGPVWPHLTTFYLIWPCLTPHCPIRLSLATFGIRFYLRLTPRLTPFNPILP